MNIATNGGLHMRVVRFEKVRNGSKRAAHVARIPSAAQVAYLLYSAILVGIS